MDRARCAALLCAGALAAACASVPHPARRSTAEPPSERELQAARDVASPGCSRLASSLLPGAAALCQGRTAEGVALATLAAGELTTGVLVAAKHDVTYPGAAVPLLALSDLVLATSFESALQEQLARRVPLTPQDTLLEKVVAPFNPAVLAAPDVWLGILGTFALGLAATAVTDGLSAPSGGKPVLFGRQLQQGAGYATAGAIGAGFFLHVAVAEESVFRGYFQSAFARRSGEDLGWVQASLLFGALHAPNALFMDGSQRLRYLAVGVPFITLLGSYLGQSYRWHGYSLQAPVAIHFWYDLLISAASFAMDVRNNQLSGTLTFPF